MPDSEIKIEPWRGGLFQLGHHLQAIASEEPDTWHTFQVGNADTRVGIRLKGGHYTFLIAKMPQVKGDEAKRRWRLELDLFAKYFGIATAPWSEKHETHQSIATRSVSKSFLKQGRQNV